jgi:hypothetical protein
MIKLSGDYSKPITAGIIAIIIVGCLLLVFIGVGLIVCFAYFEFAITLKTQRPKIQPVQDSRKDEKVDGPEERP